MASRIDSDQIREAIAEGSKSFLVQLPPRSYFDGLIELLEDMLDDGYTGIYLSFQRPCFNLRIRFKEHGMPLTNLHIIDATPVALGEHLGDQEECTILEPDAELSDIADAIEAIEQSTQPERFVFVDSITMLSLYRSDEETEQFIDFLHDKLDLNGTRLFINAPTGVQQELVTELEADVDKVIRYDG